MRPWPWWRVVLRGVVVCLSVDMGRGETEEEKGARDGEGMRDVHKSTPSRDGGGVASLTEDQGSGRTRGWGRSQGRKVGYRQRGLRLGASYLDRGRGWRWAWLSGLETFRTSSMGYPKHLVCYYVVKGGGEAVEGSLETGRHASGRLPWMFRRTRRPCLFKTTESGER